MIFIFLPTRIAKSLTDHERLNSELACSYLNLPVNWTIKLDKSLTLSRLLITGLDTGRRGDFEGPAGDDITCSRLIGVLRMTLALTTLPPGRRFGGVRGQLSIGLKWDSSRVMLSLLVILLLRSGCSSLVTGSTSAMSVKSKPLFSNSTSALGFTSSHTSADLHELVDNDDAFLSNLSEADDSEQDRVLQLSACKSIALLLPGIMTGDSSSSKLSKLFEFWDKVLLVDLI